MILSNQNQRMKVPIQTTSILDEEPYFSRVKELVEDGETNTSIAEVLRKDFHGFVTTRDSIRRFRDRHGLSVPTKDSPGLKIDGDEATLTTPPKPYPHMDDPDAMLIERGLDPSEWQIEGATINEWDGPAGEGTTITYHQAKLQLKRRRPLELLLPGRQPMVRIGGPARKAPQRDSRLVVMVGDQQAPYHDETLHRLFTDWLTDNQPDEGVLVGDTVDFPDISRHADNPEQDATVQECIDSGVQILHDYAMAAPTKWTKLMGNHDERIRNYQINQAAKLYGVRPGLLPGEVAGHAALSIPHLLRLDELGINFIDPNGKYDQAQHTLSKYLAVRHGWLAAKGAGRSALSTLDHLGYSIVVGHTHRQSIVHQTKHDIDGTTSTRVGVETGCMCKIGLGYAVAEDWQNGFATATIWPDGEFHIDLATYVNGRIYWRDRIYE